MAGNSRRVGFRADTVELALIQRAASVVNEPTSEFVRKAAPRGPKMCCAEGS